MPHATSAPDEFQSITPQLVVRGAAQAIDFYRRAFGASELLRNAAPDGERIMHAELLLGGSRFLVHDEFPDEGVLGPAALGGTPVTLHLYVRDAEATFRRAVDAGAEVVMPLQDAFWGDRYGILRDPFGHRWSVASRLEDLSPADLKTRAAEWRRASGERRADGGE